MKITKERAKKPLIEDGNGHASTGYKQGETTFTLNCYGPWTQGKGYESSYTLHLTKFEMLCAVSTWMNKLRDAEADEQKKRASAVAPASSNPVENTEPGA